MDPLERRVFLSAAAAALGTEVHSSAPANVLPFLRALPPADRRLLGLLLRMLEFGSVLRGRLARFSSLALAERQAILRGWAGSRLAARRQGVGALKALAALGHYGDPSAWPAVAYGGPWVGRKRVPVLAAPDLGARATGGAEGRAPSRSSSRGSGGDRRPRASAGLPPGLSRGRDAARDLRVRAQVCVIGTGAGGAAALAHLAERGLDVVAVEVGPYTGAADFTQHELEMLPHLFQDAALRSTADKSIGILQGRGVGGSTLHNTGMVYPTPTGIMRRWRSEHGLEVSDAEMSWRISAVLDTLGAAPIPEHHINANNQALRRGARLLGWRHRVVLHNRVECSACGYCMLGCAYNRKNNAALTYLPRAVAAGARILSDAAVVRLEGRQGARRVLCELRDAAGQRTGRRAVVEASTVVVAAGALDTPALLAASGLGNERVGRGLRLHPAGMVAARFPEPVIAWRGLPQAVVVEEFASFEDDGRGGWLFIPNAASWPGITAAVLPAWGTAHRERMTELPRLASATVLLHDETEGRVGSTRDGRPVARYWPEGGDLRELRSGLGSLARLYLAAGAERVYLPHADVPPVGSEGELDRALGKLTFRKHLLSLNSVHPQGTCALGNDPNRSAVDPRGELWGSRGIFVADASLFPTSVGVPPQVTIMALAGMVADGIAAVHG